MKHFLGMALIATAGLCHAQASAPSSPAKKDLVQKIMVGQQPAIDNMARTVAEGPARQMMAAADVAMQQRVPQEKRKATADQIEGSLRKYLDEAVPLTRERATKIGQTTLAPMLEEKFSEEELRQLLAALEAPAYKKFQQNLPELSGAFMQKLVADAQQPLEGKLKVLEQRVAEALGIPIPAAASAPKGAKPAANAASKPAKK